MKCTWKGPGGQSCARRPHADWEFCRDHIVEAITLAKLAATKKGSTTLGALLRDLAITTVKVAVRLSGGTVTDGSTTTLRHRRKATPALGRIRKKGGKKKGVKRGKKAAQKA